ncbi:MAG: hypothetical protein AB1405_18150, partial [Bdellovibrionota bacterium]
MSKGLAAEKIIFGEVAEIYCPFLGRVNSIIQGQKYTIISRRQFDSILEKDPGRGHEIYWNEMLGRVHQASAATLIRQYRWIRGMVLSIKSYSYLPYAACARGFLESAADSFSTLGCVPGALADNFPQIKSAITGQFEGGFFSNEDLENKLIHFTHARKLEKDEEKIVPPSHKAETMRRYIDELQNSQIHDYYAFLCNITHPAAYSVA